MSQGGTDLYRDGAPLVNLILARLPASLVLATVAFVPAVLAADAAPATPEAKAPASFEDALTGGDAQLEFRYRIESVDQDPFADDALASTLRSRLNYRTLEYHGWSLFAEVDNNTVIGDDEDYNSTTNGITDRPIIADPEYTEVNQAYLQFKTGALTGIGGRQRITLDDHRFIGNVGWRQNEQTYDALTFKGSPRQGIQLHYSWIANVNRVFGPDEGSQSANFHGAMHALNGKADLGKAGALTAYGYLLDIENAPALSSQTFGLQWTGTYPLAATAKLNWIAAYASQRDTGDNPNDYSADYYRLEGGATRGPLGLKAGYEVLGGDDTPNHAFQTPLATLHAFQGWADKFLTTPTGGVTDLYVGAMGNLGPVALQLVWHDFEAEAFSRAYGSEWDASATYKFGAKKNYEALLKFADYQADGFAADTTKVWVQFSATF